MGEDAALAAQRWYAVARAAEVAAPHLLPVQLCGVELVLWRDAGGQINAWEDRCPHRGVRLSIGLHRGQTLQCQYHGWRFASGSGACRFIPSQPDQPAPAAIRARPYPVREQGGFVWVTLGGETTPLPAPLPADSTTLRSLWVEAPLVRLSALLADRATPGDDLIFHQPERILLLQPATRRQTLLHGLLPRLLAADQRLAELRRHHQAMLSLRDAAERAC